MNDSYEIENETNKMYDSKIEPVEHQTITNDENSH